MFATTLSSFPAQPLYTGTARLISKDTHHIRQISHTSKEEEQHADTFCAPSSVVQKQLGYTAAKIEGRTEVSEDLTPQVEVETVRGIAAE